MIIFLRYPLKVSLVIDTCLNGETGGRHALCQPVALDDDAAHGGPEEVILLGKISFIGVSLKIPLQSLT